jgi:hypothetical protein
MILDEFYEVLMARLSTLPEIKHIDIYYGQYDDPVLDEKGNPIAPDFNRPAVFIEFPSSIELKPLAMRRKTAEIVFKLHVVQDVIQEISKRTPSPIRVKGHAHKINVDKVQAVVEGFNGNQVVSGYNQFDSISWIGMNPYIFMGQQIVDILSFRVKLTSDNSRITYTQLENLTPPILSPVENVTFEVTDL